LLFATLVRKLPNIFTIFQILPTLNLNRSYAPLEPFIFANKKGTGKKKALTSLSLVKGHWSLVKTQKTFQHEDCLNLNLLDLLDFHDFKDSPAWRD